MKSWNGSVTGVVEATARSTCSSPSTWRRTVIPCCLRSASSMAVLLVQLDLDCRVCVQGRGDEGVRGAEVPGRLQGGLDLLRGDACRGQAVLELGHGQQHVAQRQAGAHRPLARAASPGVRAWAPEA